MESQVKVPPLEEVVELIRVAYSPDRYKFLDKYVGLGDLIGNVEYAYGITLNYLSEKQEWNKFWELLADFTFSSISFSELPIGCKEAFEILTLKGKDCELKEFRRIVNEAGIVSKLEIDEVEPTLLAKYFLNSAFALEIDALVSEAKELWEEKVNAKN